MHSDKQFYKFERQTDGAITKTPLGKKIDPSRFTDTFEKIPVIKISKITIDAVDTQPIKATSGNVTEK